MKINKELFFNFFTSLYSIICISFLYKQYITVSETNISNYSNFEFFIRDNVYVIGVFVIVFITIIFNLFHFLENWVFTTKEEIKIKEILGYNFSELLKHYYCTFILNFVIAFVSASIIMIPVFLYLKMFVVKPIIDSFLFLFITLSLTVLSSLVLILKRSKENKKIGLGNFKIVSFIFQFTMSLLLISTSLMLVNDSFVKLSPYKLYTNMENGWILEGECLSKEKDMEVDNNLEMYKDNLTEKIKSIYMDYSDKIIVNYRTTQIHSELGDILNLNKKSFEINNIDYSIFEPFLNLPEQPIILSHSFLGKYKEGDIIKNEPINYIVAKVMGEDETFRIVAPNDYGDIEAESVNIALFENRYIDNASRLENFNFINYLYFDDISEMEIKEINEYINQPLFKYSYSSISELQMKFNSEKMNLLISFMVIGVCILIFTLIGLISVVYMDISIRSIEFSIMKLTGYTNRYIYLVYLSFISVLFITSYIISQIFAKQTGAHSNSIAILVLLISTLLFATISLISVKYIKDIDTVKVIGGENV